MQELARRFVHLVRDRDAGAFDAWLADCDGVSGLRSFGDGLRRAYAAVKAALVQAWSNAQTEGHVNRLKLLKRQMYGRAGFDLLVLRTPIPCDERRVNCLVVEGRYHLP